MAEGEGARIAMTPPWIFKNPSFLLYFWEKKLNIIFYRTDINLNNDPLIFLPKTYNLIGVFLEFYLHHHGSAMTMRSLLNGIKSYLYHRARSHYHWIPCSFLFLSSMKTRSALVKTKKCGSTPFFGDRS